MAQKARGDRRTRTPPWVLAGAAAGLAIVAVLAACVPRRPAPVAYDDDVPPLPLISAAEAGGFVGAETCAGCHPARGRDHSASLHARTLARSPDGRTERYFRTREAVRDRALGMTYSLREEAGKPVFRVARGDGAAEEMTPAYVVGSGRFGHTFLFERGGRFMESRLSYYPPLRRWTWTPGQQQQIPFRAPMGSVLDEGSAIACFICHSTNLVREGGVLRPDLSRLNVTCERCHGPGRAHVESIRAGRGPAAIYSYRRAGQATMMRLCGECHRAPEAIPPEELETHPDLPRFSGTALAASACYQRSLGRLTCLTCHDPHRGLSTDMAAYERTCRGCHTGAHDSWKPCPVNRQSGCVGCHMPAEVLGDPAPIAFRNHWVRVLKGEAALRAPRDAPRRTGRG